MLLEKLTLGDTLEIYIDRDETLYKLKSKIEKTNSKKVCVSLIAANNKVFKFKSTDKIRIIYHETNRAWEWENVKAGVAKLEGVPVHYFEIKDEGKSFNRREAYRVNLDAEVLLMYYEDTENNLKLADIPHEIDIDEEIKNIEAEEINETNEPNMSVPIVCEAVIKDISSTGVGLYTNIEFNIDDTMFFEIPSSYGNLKVKAQVVRCSELTTVGRKYSYYYGCSFFQVDKRLTKYIYDFQREQLKKYKNRELGRR